MKNVYQKFLSSCTLENQKIINNYIEKSIEEISKDNYSYTTAKDSYLSNLFGVKFHNGYSELKEKNIFVSIGYKKVRLSSEISIDDNYKFYVSVVLEVNKRLEHEYNIILGIDNDKDNNSQQEHEHFEAEYALEPDGSLYIINVVDSLELNIETKINWYDTALVDFIFNSYSNPENLKEFAGIIHDIDYENDDILKFIYKSSILLENNNTQLKLKEKLK